MKRVIDLAYFVIRHLPGPVRVTTGVIVAPYVKRSLLMGKNILRFASRLVYYPFGRVGLHVLKSAEQSSLPSASRELTSFPLQSLQKQWLTSLSWVEIILGVYTTLSLLKLAYGFVRGRKTTFTPSQAFVKAVKEFVEKPWDAILILFQLGSSTVIVAGIVYVVLKYIHDLKGKSFLPLNKKDRENSSLESEDDRKLLK